MENVSATKVMLTIQPKFAQYVQLSPMDSSSMEYAQFVLEIWFMMEYLHADALLEKLPKDLNASVNVKMTNSLIPRATVTLAQPIKSFQEENVYVQLATHSIVVVYALFLALPDSSPSKEHVQLALSTQSLTQPSMDAHAPQDST